MLTHQKVSYTFQLTALWAFVEVTLGGMLYGPAGVIGANLAGASIFALTAAWLCRKLIREKSA